MQVGDLVKIVSGDKNSGKIGIIVEKYTSHIEDMYTVYIGTVGYSYRHGHLEKVECSK